MSTTRRSFLLLAAALTGTAPVIGAPGMERGPGWAPFESPHGLVIVTARLNDNATVRLLVDSGDPAGLTLGDAAARAARAGVGGAPVQTTIGLFGGETLALRRMRIERLDLGGVILRDLEGYVAPEATSFARAVGTAVDGFIGVGLLRRLCLTIDYPARRILIERRPALPFEAGDPEVAEVGLRLEAGRVTVPVSLHGQEGHRMILDTASAATFLDAGLAKPAVGRCAGRMPIIDGGGRRRDLPLHRLPSLSLGAAVFEAIDVALYQGDDLRRAGLIESPTISGIIGADLLARCRVRLDVPRGRLAIRLAPPRGEARPDVGSGVRE